MILSFKQFIITDPLNQQKTFVSEGISHIEDLSVDDFIYAIENFNKMIATQKLDGANLRFGFDAEGKFYTSRESKGGRRFYKSSDYSTSFSAWDGFRAAHQALFEKKDILASVVQPGEACEVEILYRRQPNAITYGKGGFNYIAFLRMLATEENDSPNQSKIDKLIKKLDQDVVSISSTATDTDDGENLITVKENSKWKFTIPEKIPAEKFKSVNLTKEVNDLKKFLKAPNKKAKELGQNLSNGDVLKSKKRDLSEEGNRIKNVIMNDYKLIIKQTLLQSFVRNIKPNIQDTELHSDEDVGIEGVVFLDPSTQKQFKIVDKDMFTTINSFNHTVRASVSGTIMTADPNATLMKRGGIFGEAKLQIYKLFGIEGLTTGLSIKKTLAKFGGNRPEELVLNMVKSLKDVKFQPTKKKIEAILLSTIEQLDKNLKNFKDNIDKYKQELPSGKVIGFSPETKRRTLLTFAETKKELQEILTKIRNSKNIADIIIVLFKRQIKDIFTEESQTNE